MATAPTYSNININDPPFIGVHPQTHSAASFGCGLLTLERYHFKMKNDKNILITT
jgi:hypothetical protein